MSAATEARRIWPPTQSNRGQQNEPAAGRWTWNIGRLFGIDIYIHATFALLLAWVAFTQLLPAFPMDGGRVIRAGLALKMDYAQATEIAARLGQGLALVFGVVGLFYSPMLLFIALFVWMGAKQEFTAVGLKRALSGVPIERAMITEFRVLSPSDRLSAAAELITAGFQHDFPVVDGRQLVGVLTRSDVVAGLSRDGVEGSVANAMHRQFEQRTPPTCSRMCLLGSSQPKRRRLSSCRTTPSSAS